MYRSFLKLILAITFSSLAVYVIAGENQVHHTFSIGVGKGTPEIRNLSYLYGILGWRQKPIAAPGPLSSLSGPMVVPDTFEISWVALDGKNYEFSVPVRSVIHQSVEDKEINFVILKDHVEGYLLTRISPGKYERLRFY